jgi:hypothetical protein
MNGGDESKKAMERRKRGSHLKSGNANKFRDSFSQNEIEGVNGIGGAIKMTNNLRRMIKDLMDRFTFTDEIPEEIIKENVLRNLLMAYLLTVSIVGESILSQFFCQPFELEGQRLNGKKRNHWGSKSDAK